MTEAQPVEQTSHSRAVDHHPASRQRHTQFVQGQLAVLRHTRANELGMRTKLATAAATPLRASRERTCLGLQLH